MTKLILVAIASVALAACQSTANYAHGGGGGGGSVGGYVDGWGERPDLVDSSGNATVNENETVTEHSSNDENDFGFSGDGPPSIDG